ncbi:MAG: endonuclease/exonuclease/phosphatase family protein [Pseudobutyrivibrio sp.]|nr:endonuclease/exonuclease/phosphatase family protein [Pseudobutyrivibrio sp.]
MVKKILKTILAIVIALLLIVAIYFAYLMLSYHRIDDNTKTDIEEIGSPISELELGKQYRISSANLGFGAYSDDYSFFMDGGTESWAFSKDAVKENLDGSIDSILTVNPDIMMFQEVDVDATRSYHTNQKAMIIDALKANDKSDLSYTFALNYDSGFLMYPLYKPHGKTKAGLLTMSPAVMQDSTRRSLPIETGLSKFIDLDRCYDKIVINTNSDKKLIIYNAHLSAYTTNPATADNQVKMLSKDMADEYAKGNYVIAGGDMNKDVLHDSSAYFGKTCDENWASPFPEDYLDSNLTLVKPLDESNPIPSCRNANEPYGENTFVVTIDGFIVSNNVEVKYANVLDTGFKHSDHNPIYMDFILK